MRWIKVRRFSPVNLSPGAYLQAAKMLSSPSPPATIIVVEDDTSLRDALRFALEVDGYQVISCASGEALLDLDLPESSACLVIDQNLGGRSGLTGLATLGELRARGARIPAVLITSAASTELRVRAMQRQAQVIEKPLLNDALLAAIRSGIAA